MISLRDRILRTKYESFNLVLFLVENQLFPLDTVEHRSNPKPYLDLLCNTKVYRILLRRI